MTAVELSGAAPAAAGWDARQRAMLEAMGLRVFQRAPLGAAPLAAATAPARAAGQPATAVRQPALAPAPAPADPMPPPAPGGPRPALPLQGFDLDGLRGAVADCRACGLCEQRRLPVFGHGGVAPRWLVLVDPPDEPDDASGELLGGPAGMLLDRMLAAAGLGDPQQSFITPLVKCRPPRGRQATPAEVAACDAILARQIALLRPQLILAMGLQAAQGLTGRREPLGKLRGVLHQAHGLPVVATYHPAYLLRNPADKAGAWADLCLARAQAMGQP